MGKQKNATYIFNLVSISGVLIAVVAAGLIVAMIAVEAISGVESPYLGILTYFMFPGMLVFGILLVPLGMYRVRARRKAEAPDEIPSWPRFDLNDPAKRRVIFFFTSSCIVYVLIVMVATIKGYEFSEAPVFCGELCHVPMEPENTAWQNSPHAHVKCVECHVGPGAKWYVKAKISGMRQLYAVTMHTFPTPIETPIENLRPARDTCEHCHWPEKFYSGSEKVFNHYAPNEANTQRQIDMLLKIGVTKPSSGDTGIHSHINRDIFYISRDKQRLDIPYIAVKGKDGKITEYLDSEKPISKAEIAKSNKRLMDCVDCHNRPAHIYRSPNDEMDMNFISGRIDQSLPFMKKVAVELLDRPYKTKEEALATIAAGVPAYYAQNYPKVAREKGAAINQAVERMKDIYERNFFPLMKVKWDTYPNHIGHFSSPGCFRCHDGKHKTIEGKVISKDCNLCHTVLRQIQENVPVGTTPKNFVHPVDIGDELYKTNCSECHATGGHNVPGEGKQQAKQTHQ